MTQHKCPLLQALPLKGKTTQLRTSTFYLLMLARIALENGATGVINFQVTPRFCKNCSQFKKKYLASIEIQKLLILGIYAIQFRSLYVIPSPKNMPSILILQSAILLRKIFKNNSEI